MQGEAEIAGTAQLGEGMAHRGPYPCAKVPEGVQRGWILLPGVPSDRKQSAQNETREIPLKQNKPFFSVGVIKILELAVQ